jgi:SAM-dependent methyltransferase
MDFTGERLIPGIPRLENMIIEELGRLNFARDYFQNVAALDFGCGAGYAAHFMVEHGAATAIGIDLFSDAVRSARNRYNRPKLFYAQMNCLNVALPSASFDFICSLDVIEHFSEADINRFLSEIVRLLTPGGYCLITTPNKRHSSPHYETPSWVFHLKEFFFDEFQSTLDRFFSQVEIFGGRVPIYEDRAVRKLTNSRLALIKHFLPPKLRVGFASSLRYLLKPDLKLDDIVVTNEAVEKARVFVALCRK